MICIKAPRARTKEKNAVLNGESKMQVRALTTLGNTARLELITLHSALGAAVLWIGIVIREWPQLTAYGRICGETVALFGHCPLCFPAAALTIMAFAGAATLLGRDTGRA